MELAVKTMPMKPKPHFDFAELVADAIDLRMDAKPIQRAASQLIIQALSIAQQAGILPARLTAETVAHLRVHPREEDIQLIKFGAKLPQIGIAVIPVLIPVAIFVAPIIRIRRRAETSDTEEDQRCN